MTELRPYQQEAVDAICKALNSGMRSPCISVATGGGKSLIIQSLTERFSSKGKPTVILTHVKELVEQLAKRIPTASVNAASLSRREVGDVTIAQVQSVYKQSHLFGHVKIIIVDECHLIPPDNEGMFRTFIEGIAAVQPGCRIIGLSATPYRMSSGFVYGEGRLFEDCVYTAGMGDLISQGYLTPLIGKNGDQKFDGSSLHMRGGDFIPAELEAFMADRLKVTAAVREMLVHSTNRNRKLVFSSGNKHSAMITEELTAAGQRAAYVTGEMGMKERESILSSFKTGACDWLVNCGILTTGYDDPQIDFIGLLRPTRSPGLLLQIAGRGLRLHEHKTNCMFLDFGGALTHFGPLDLIEQTIKRKGTVKIGGECPMKTCPECAAVIHAGRMMCDCGHVFPRDLKHETQASNASPLATIKILDCASMTFSLHLASGSSVPVLKVMYWDSTGLMPGIVATEYLSFDANAHPFARANAHNWLRNAYTKCDSELGIKIDNGRVIGTVKGVEQPVLTCKDMLQYQSCFVSPCKLHIAPDPKKPKYQRIIAREWP